MYLIVHFPTMNRIIGDQGLEFARIIRAVQRSPSYCVLKSKISNLRIGLDIQDKEGLLTNSLITLGLTELSVVLETVLKLWRQEHPTEATLEKLIKVFFDNDLGDFAEQLKQEFKGEIESDPETPTENNIPAASTIALAISAGLCAVAAGRAQNMSPVVDIRPEDLCLLDFGDQDVKQVVLKKLAPDITKVFSSVDVNKAALLQLNTLGIFDDIELEHIIHGQFRTERERITEFLGLLHHRESEEIRLCLEMLCNLDGMRARRIQIRKSFNEKFPGCVKNRMPREL